MPNILIYMSDEHNPLYSSVYGNPQVKTPNMERLAEMGTVFENTYCPSPLCRPSRSAFMSGKPVHEVQAYNNCNVITSDYPTYGKVLKDQGIYTTYAGKLDVYNKSEELGFSEIIKKRDRSQPGDTNIKRKPLQIREGSRERAKGYGPKENPFQDDTQVIDEALNWIENKGKNLDKSWTFTVNTGAPHFPHYVTEELWDLYADAGNLPEYGPECSSAKHPYAKDLRDHFETDYFSDEDIKGLRRGYLGCVTYVDSQLGRLIDTLEETGQLENTIIVYTSDHGEMLGKFGMWWKCSLYEDSVRVPLLIAGPGFGENKRVKTPVSLLDLQATIFDILEKNRPPEWQGQSLKQVNPNNPEKVAFSEYHGHGVRASAYMIRKGNWKLLYNVDAPHQLFNLEQDPHELKNLAKENQEKLEELINEIYNICDPERENKRADQYIEKQLNQI